MLYILRKKNIYTREVLVWYASYYLLLTKMFYLFFFIRTGGTKPTWKNEHNRSSTLGPRNLNHMDILRDVFISRIFSRFLQTAVWILFFNLSIFVKSNIKLFVEFTNGNLSRKLVEHGTFSFQPCERA